MVDKKETVSVVVACAVCGKRLRRTVAVIFLSADGTLKRASYCRKCQLEKMRKYTGKSVKELMGNRNLEKYGCRTLSKKEINELYPGGKL